MDPINNNPGAEAPPPTQEDLGQTRYFPPVGAQGETQVRTQAPGTEQATGYNGNAAGGVYTPEQAQVPPQPAQPPYAGQIPPYGQYSPPNGQPIQPGQPGQQYGPVPGGPWQWPAGNTDHNRALWGIILVGAGILFLVDQLFSFQGFGSFFLLAIGGAFMYAYFNKNRWAVIPGGILLGLGAGTLLEDLDVFNFWGGGIVPFMLGLGFCTIWFFERRHWWALIPGGILAIAGLSSILVIGRFWPLLLIALGVYLLYEQSRRKVTR
jgi:hypothetical protein